MKMDQWGIVTGDFAGTGGMDTANIALAERWAETNKIHLVTHRVAPELAATGNITVELVARPKGIHFVGSELLRRAASKVQRTSGLKIISNGGNVDRPDVCWIHMVHGACQPYPIGSFVRRLKTKLVHRLAIRNEGRALANSRLVICNSQKTADEVEAIYGVSASKIEVVYLATDVAKFSEVSEQQRSQARTELQLENRPWVVFVGQFGNGIKGFDLLYAAWNEACKVREFDAGLLVVGNGIGLAGWKKRTLQDGLNARIRFLGYRHDVEKILAASDAMVHPSRYDAYGLSVHQGLCRGVPAIVSANTGISELFPKELQPMVFQLENASELSTN
jgi:glycosyltransferase involved in cell wall biosynthesis